MFFNLFFFLDKFTEKIPKSPVRELLELEPETAKFELVTSHIPSIIFVVYTSEFELQFDSNVLFVDDLSVQWTERYECMCQWWERELIKELVATTELPRAQLLNEH